MPHSIVLSDLTERELNLIGVVRGKGLSVFVHIEKDVIGWILRVKVSLILLHELLQQLHIMVPKLVPIHGHIHIQLLNLREYPHIGSTLLLDLLLTEFFQILHHLIDGDSIILGRFVLRNGLIVIVGFFGEVLLAQLFYLLLDLQLLVQVEVLVVVEGVVVEDVQVRELF